MTTALTLVKEYTDRYTARYHSTEEPASKTGESFGFVVVVVAAAGAGAAAVVVAVVVLELPVLLPSLPRDYTSNVNCFQSRSGPLSVYITYARSGPVTDSINVSNQDKTYIWFLWRIPSRFRSSDYRRKNVQMQIKI